MRRRFAFFLFTSAIVGCNAILGIESGDFVPVEDGGLDANPPPSEAGGDATNDAGGRDSTVLSETGGLDAMPDGDADAAVADADAAAPDADASGPDADADASCGNVLTDPLNCGTCGHDCLGGICIAGACQPFEVSSETDKSDLIDGIAIDATHVYYTNLTTGQVRRVVRDGSTPSELVYQGAANVGLGNDIAVGGGFVYFIDAENDPSRIVRCPTAGCPGAAETVLGGLGFPHSLALTSTGIVTGESKTGGRVLRCQQLPCEANPEILSASELRPERMVVLGDTVAWTTLGVPGVTPTSVRVKQSGQTVFTAREQNGIFAVALTAQEVVYSTSASIDAVIYAPMSVPRNLAKPVNCDQLFVLGPTLFYTDKSNDEVRRVDLASPVSTLVAANQSSPRSIVADAVAVYWLNTGNATVMGIAR